MGPAVVPDSSIHDTPVISPLPFWEWTPGGTRIARVRSTARVDRRDPRPDVVAFDQRGVPDLHTGHIREGVVGPGPAREGDPEGTSSRLPGGRLEDRCLRRHAMLRGSVSRPRLPSTSYLRFVRSIIFWISSALGFP